MEATQLLLTGGNGKATDMSVHISKNGSCLFLFLGLALLERVPLAPETLNYKTLIGRLFNAGFGLRELCRKFGHDHRTIQRWGQALLSDDIEFSMGVFSGRGQAAKMGDAIQRMIRMRYRELKGTARDYRRRIMDEVSYCFQVDLSRETVRRVFRFDDSGAGSMAVPLPPGADDSAVRIPPDAKVPPANDNRSPAPGIEDMEKPAESAPGSVADSDPSSVSGTIRPQPEEADPPDGERASIGNTETGCPDSFSASAASMPGGSGGGAGTDLPDRTTAASDNRSPTPGGKDEGEAADIPRIPFSGSIMPVRDVPVHHAGMILYAPWLDMVRFGFPGELRMQTQWLSQILQGAVNIEQSKKICFSDLARMIGPVTPGLDTQRRELWRQAETGPETVHALLEANARLLPSGPGGGSIFYLDAHTKEYCGELDILKGWCGRIHGIAKVMHLDFIHTENGSPCFVCHYDNYYDFRERFFMTLHQFDTLFLPGAGQGRTFVIDRGIFGIETFSRIMERGDRFITWEKGYDRKGWDAAAPAAEFIRTRFRNNSGDPLFYRFRCQEQVWVKNPGIRRILVRAVNPQGNCIEVAILCSGYDLELEHIVALMFNRWIQENDFRVLDSFGIMQITSYSSRPYRQIRDTLKDKPVMCPEYRALKAQLKKLETELQKQLLKRERLTDRLNTLEKEMAELRSREKNMLEKAGIMIRTTVVTAPDAARNLAQAAELVKAAERCRRQAGGIEKKSGTLKKKIGPVAGQVGRLKRQCDEIEGKINAALRQDSKLALLVMENYHRLDTRAKAVMDALKITARNMFYALLAVFRPMYDNYRDDHVILRTLTQASGFLSRKNGGLQVKLWIKGNPQPATVRIIDRFLHAMSEFINGHFQGRAAPVRITLHTPEKPS